MASSILKSSAAPHRARKSSIAWDESNLGDNDAYLASTTREKIIEPKTPYSEPLGAQRASSMAPDVSLHLSDHA